MKTFIKAFLYAGIDKEMLPTVRKAFVDEHRKGVMLLSLVVGVLLSCLAVYTHFFDNPYQENAYAYVIIALVEFVIFALARFSAPQHPSIVKTLVFANKMILYALGVALSSVLDPTNYALGFVIMIIVVPLIFFDVPVKNMAYAFVVSCLFLPLSYYVKEFVVFQVDVINVVVWGTASLFLNCILASARANNQLVIFQNAQTQEKLEMSLKRVNDQVAVLYSMGNVFSSIYYLDVKSRTFKSLTPSGMVFDVVGAEGEAEERIAFFGFNKVRSEHRSEFFKFMNLDTLIDRLKVNPVISLQFMTKLVENNKNDFEWAEANFIAVKQEGESEISHVLFATRGINEEKERELDQRERLQEALDLAQSASNAKTTFLNNMSHDIRTPMNAIIGFTDLARRHLDQTESVKDYLAKIATASDHLLALINDVLDMSRIESGRISLNETPASIKAIADELDIIIQEDVQAKFLELTVNTDKVAHDKVQCDKLRLKQILLNLLGNAVKFNKVGGKIALTIEETESSVKEYGLFTFKVKDTGFGMSKEFLKKVFDPFEREQTSTISGVQGTGLGMSIAKNLAEMMGGSINVESEVNQGTEFIFQVNLKYTAEVQTVVAPDTSEDRFRPDTSEGIDTEILKGKRILLVEDNRMNQMFALHLLRDLGATIEVADNGSIACNMLQKAGPGVYDVVLMDIQMPVMNGYEATQKIRHFPERALALTPIVAMTANAFEEDKKMALEAGMDGHVSKPIVVNFLLKTLMGVLKK